MIGLCAAVSGAYAGGSLVSWGRDFEGQVSGTPFGNNIVAVSAGGAHGVALRSDGSLVSWGFDNYGQVSGTPVGNDFVAVDGGGLTSVALRANGSLISWGYDGYGVVSGTPAGSDFVAVSAGFIQGVALRADGSLVSWGYDANGVVSGTPAGNNFVAVSAGDNHSVALRSDGSLVSWGYDALGQVSGTPSGTGFVAVSAGTEHSAALRADGTLVSWGYDGFGQVSGTPSGNDFVAVSAGQEHSIARRVDGSLVAWGSDLYGESSATPAGNGFVVASAGGYFSVALGPALTPEAQIAAISNAVQALVTIGVLLPSQGNSLQTKLGAALDLVTRGNTQGAISKLNDFIKQVNSFIKTGKLTSDQGQPLIDAAKALIVELGGASTLATRTFSATDGIARGAVAPSLTSDVAESFHLYPGSFDAARGAITLRFDLPRRSDVMVELYDIAGRRIDELRLGSMGAGRQEWSSARLDLPSELLFYRLRAGDLMATGKVAFVR
jgi:Regulator of Chromosome Condensation (RCC1) repeat protein/FIMAH domain-containing protein